MNLTHPGGSLARAASGIMRLLGGPVRRAQGESGVVLEPCRGYGTRSEVFLIGRVFQQAQADPVRERGVRSELRDIGRRLSRHSIPGAAVMARFYGAEERVTTDPNG